MLYAFTIFVSAFLLFQVQPLQAGQPAELGWNGPAQPVRLQPQLA